MSYSAHTKKRKWKRRKRKKRKKRRSRRRKGSKKINIQYKNKRRKPFFTVKKHNYMSHQKTRKKKSQKIHIIPDVTPHQNKLLRHEISMTITQKLVAPHSFSPQINKVIQSLKSVSPNVRVFSCLQQRKINITKGGRKKCVGWKTNIARKTLLNNLLSKNPIRCDDIIGPKQSLSNCWFNAFFMVFFISDKGRKFHRFLRIMMITSMLPSGEEIKPSLQWPFFLLNKYIEASLRGKNDPSRFAKLMDTNAIIRKIYHKIHKYNPNIVKTRVPANPLSYYIAIMEYLGKGKAHFALSWINIYNASYKEILKTIQHELDVKHRAPNILFVEYSDDNTLHKKREIKLNYQLENYTYVLDSAVLRDTQQQHFSAYITCNKKDYGFDGESFSRISPFVWKNKLNKDTQWRFAEKYDTYFNFTKGYQLLIYYRT